jgi:ligand-binding sensor domain-containing protein
MTFSFPYTLNRLRSGGFLVALFLLPNAAPALDPDRQLTQYAYTSWGIDEGLPQLAVLDIIQARDGYIWLVNFDGLVRFDGIKFEQIDRKAYSALGDSGFWTLVEDGSGTLWLGSNGEGLVSIKDGVSRQYTTAHGLLDNTVKNLEIDLEGNLWIAASHGLNVIRAEKSIEAFGGGRLESMRILAMHAGREGGLWIGTLDHGVYRIAGNELSAVEIDGTHLGDITSLYEASDGALWAVSGGTAVYRIMDGRAEAIRIDQREQIGRIHNIFEDSDNNIWIGAHTALLRWNGSGLAAYVDTELFGGHYAFCEDMENNLWVGTAYRGLIRLSEGKFVTLTDAEGLADDAVNVVYEDPDGSFLIGTNGGFSRVRDGNITNFSAEGGHLPDNFVRDFQRDAKGVLWIATYGGLVRWTEEEVLTITESDGLSHNHTRVLLEGSDGSLWVGTRNGLDRLKDGAFISYGIEDGLTGPTVTGLLEDRHGRIWVGTASGGVFSFEGGEFTHYGRLEGLHANAVFRFLEDTDGTLWMGTNNGLVRYKDGAFKHLSESEGLISDSVFQVLEDDYGYLWLTSGKGVTRILRNEVESYLDGNSDGIRAENFGKLRGLRHLARKTHKKRLSGVVM